MNLITGIISVIVLIGTIVGLRNKNSGFITTTFFFVALLSGIMSLAPNWNWWWTVPLGFLGLYLIGMIITQVFSMVKAAEFLKKFITLNSILSVLLILTSIIPGIKNILAPNLTLGAIIPTMIVSIAMLILSIGVGLGNGNFILGMFTIGEAFVNLGKFLWKNRGKSFVSLISIIYAIVYFSITIPQIYKWFAGTLPRSKVTLGALNVVGLFFAIVFGVAFLSATMTNFPNSMPFHTRIKQLFIGELPMKIFKILTAISLMVGLVYALFVLGGQEFPGFMGNVVTFIVQIICVIALLAAVLRFVLSNPRLLEEIKNNIFIRLLFTIVMVVPCALIYLTQGIMASAKASSKGASKASKAAANAACKTAKGASSFACKMAKLRLIAPPKTVLMVLAAEIVLVSAYILMPMFRPWFYTLNLGGDGDLVLNERIEGAQSAILAAQKTYEDSISIDGNPMDDIDWQKIYNEKLYLSTDATKKKALEAYLTSLGYRNSYSEIRDNVVVSKILGKPITLPQAISFIQTNNRVEGIIDKLIDLEQLEDKLKALEKQETNDEDGPFDSKIINNKPTYINKQSAIGTYENLKGGADDYNYNYGLNAWIYLMAQAPNYGVGYSKYTKVLDYAGKPTLWYNPEINTFKITVNVDKKGTTGPYQKTVYKTTKLPLQKWNNIVINYVGGTLDVFINKDLVASVKNVIPYMTPDTIYIGDKYGVSGAVGNVTYFSHPISTSRISLFYDSLVNKDPPII